MGGIKEQTNGRLGYLTNEESITLDQFKQALLLENLYNKDIHSDHLLLRFLRARKFQIPAAKDMWAECEKWRAEFGTNTILNDFDFPEYALVRRIYPRFYHKVDRLGRPVYIERVGMADLKKLWAATTPERMLRNHVYEYEKLIQYRFKACSKKSNRHFEQSTLIVDLYGVALSTASSVYSLITQVSSISQNYYPEMLGQMFIINAPMLFTAVWSIVKPMLDEVTIRKIQILGSGYKSTLLESISPENLPDFLGGDCKCACPGGCINSDIGPWNDGTVEGYPDPEFEKFITKYGV
ncbi:CRAL-TRIO domain-containing protein [Globomyces pollinis-pini]|nr:CRAL-TRIO domain-containing protein [Globomyces pollinis-pini]